MSQVSVEHLGFSRERGEGQGSAQRRTVTLARSVALVRMGRNRPMPDPAALADPPRHGIDLPVGLDAPEARATLHIVAWVDPVVDTLGYDPRSFYVEQFWLPVVGPTSTWFLRRVAAQFDAAPGDRAQPRRHGARPGTRGPRGSSFAFPACASPLRLFQAGRDHTVPVPSVSDGGSRRSPCNVSSGSRRRSRNFTVNGPKPSSRTASSSSHATAPAGWR